MIICNNMKKLFAIGDMHFSDARPWDQESFEKFLDWFKSYDFGPKEDCELLQLGDVTEKAFAFGGTSSLLTRWAVICTQKFSKIYILGGNHCLKYDTEKNVSFYSSSFLKEIDDSFHLIYDETEFTALDGKLKILALPFKYTASSIENYYNEQLDEHFYKTKYDIICGHLGLWDKKWPSIDGLKLNKFNYNYAAFGHIHNPCGTYSRFYTGSIMPFRKSEEKCETPRKIMVFTENKDYSEILLPAFRQYHLLDYKTEKPKHKKHSDKIVHVYEFVNCKDQNLIELNSDYYVKKTTHQKSEEIVFESNKDTASVLDEDDFKVLEQMCKDQNIILKRKTKALLKELLQQKS